MLFFLLFNFLFIKLGKRSLNQIMCTTQFLTTKVTHLSQLKSAPFLALAMNITTNMYTHREERGEYPTWQEHPNVTRIHDLPGDKSHGEHLLSNFLKFRERTKWCMSLGPARRVARNFQYKPHSI